MSYQTKILLVSLLTGLISGCAGQPFDYHPVDEIKQGPGVFSDAEGNYTLFDSNSRKEQANHASQSGKNADSSGDADQFEAFEAWKKSRDSDPSYREFKDWQEWKRYREWKKTR